MPIEPEHHYLLEQRDYTAYNTLVDATAGVAFKTNGVLVYIISLDAFYYWKESLLDWVALGSGSGALPIPILGVQANGLLYAVPAGYELEKITVTNATVANVDISLGTAALGVNIVNAATMLANQSTIQDIGYTSGPTLPAYDVYISSLAWGAAVLNIYIFLKQIV
jgi:hypothetical protein